MGILDIITKALTPIKAIIDEVVTTKEERLTLKKQMQEIELEAMSRALDYEKERLKESASIVRSEAQGKSWLQRNWRPITMLTFLVLVVCDSFGLLLFRLSNEAWTLLQIGLGGYVVGRTAEKVIGQVKFNKKNVNKE